MKAPNTQMGLMDENHKLWKAQTILEKKVRVNFWNPPHPCKRDMETKAIVDNEWVLFSNFHYLRHKDKYEFDYTLGIILEIELPN